MTARCSRLEPSHSYFVVMLNYPASYCDGIRLAPAGQEAIVDPEVTRREVISRIESGEYGREEICFIHHITGDGVSDVTEEFLHCAKWGDHVPADAADRQAARFDHARDLRKHEVV
jgi:hypothetical protein